MVASGASFAAGSPMQRIHAAGSVRIGVSMDLPGLGDHEDGAASPSGFEIELARDIAGALGLTAAQITWVKVSPADRAHYISNGLVDLVLATYAIPSSPDPAVEFAGPYLVSGQQFLVRTHGSIDDTIDLAGASVCTVTGSSSTPAVAEQAPGATTNAAASYGECISQLDGGSVKAVAGPGVIVQGFSTQDPKTYRVIGEPHTVERYGIAFSRAAGMCQFLTDTLLTLYKSGAWAAAWSESLGHDGVDPPTPPLPDTGTHSSGSLRSRCLRSGQKTS
jgi:glutamate transport system substrate-binding protein